MSNRVAGVARRVTSSRHAAPALSAMTLPYRLRGSSPLPVVAEHYGMLVGQHFVDDPAAARHYFSEGWRLGLVPHPFVDVPGARFSLARALRLRNALARLTHGQGTSTSLGVPSRFVPAEHTAQALGVKGGWFPVFDRAAREGRLPVAIGLTETSWQTYLERCRQLTDAAATVHAEQLIDLPFYQSQLGGPVFLSREAALDDLVSNGELDGRTAHPFFEPEWYAAHDRSQGRRGRPVCQLLDFVERGELGQGGPHFWGQRHLESLDADAPRPISLLRHFCDHAADDDSTPAADGVVPVRRRVAEDLLRGRVGAYHRDLGRLAASGPVRSHHATSTEPPAHDATCLVVVDERHLVSPAGAAGLARVVEQAVRGLRVVVVEGFDTARRADVDVLVDAHACLDVVQRRDGEPIGAVARRLVEEAGAEAWAEWGPGQLWEPDLLASAVAALRAHPGAPAAAVLTPSTPQAWLRTDDAVWLDGLTGAGVVLRARGEGALLPLPELDLGFVPELLIRLAGAGTSCVVIDRPLLRAEPSGDVGEHERRATANSARSRHLVQFVEPEVEVGVAIPTYQDWEMTLTAVRHVLATSADHDVRVAVVDNGSRRPVASILAACFADDDRVRVQRMPRNTDFALGSNLGSALGAGRTTVFLNNDTAVQDGWLDPLLEALDEGAAGVQPLLLYGDRCVQTAGTVFLGGLTMPSHLLTSVQVADLGPGIDEHPFSALTAACMAVRTEHVAALDGFDPRYVNGMEDVDLCLRLARLTGAPLRVRTRSRVVHLESRTVGRADYHDVNRDRFAERWASVLPDLDDRAVFDTGPIGLDRVERVRWEASPLWTGRPVLALRRPTLDVHEANPRLRWAIKTSATGDLAGDMWGDTFFADSLAAALRRLGQDVVIDRATSHNRVSSRWDDVTLALRGLTEYVPQPDAINLLWVISHPDLVTRHELSSGFARIYAAGAGWAQQVGRRWGIDVRTLLQATDVQKFHPGVDRGAERRGVLFVGRTRGVPRVIVKDVIAAGGDPDVYGDDGWEQFIDPRFVRGTGIHNDDVPAAYGGAAVVLNDHWADMAQHGFFSNRLFDAAATGARIVSDPVPGLTDLFGPQVQMYGDIARLGDLLDASSPHWPDDDELTRLARRITDEHSFDARARVLLDDALEVARERR